MSNAPKPPLDPHHIDDLAVRREKALAMGGPAKVDKLHAAGKLTVHASESISCSIRGPFAKWASCHTATCPKLARRPRRR